MAPRPSVREQRSEQIIDAALKVFSEQGFNHATMDEIAEEAGLSKGTLYWYFNGKDKIISNLLKWFFEREYSQLDNWMQAGDPPREVLEKITNLVIEDLTSVRAFMPVMFEFIALSFRNQAVGEVVRESMYGFVQRLTPVFEQGIEKGDFIDRDSYELSLAFGAMIEGSIMIWSYDMKKINLEKMMKNSMKLFLDGITIK